MPLAAGEKLGPYEIVRPIGAGGMGDVYLGTDSRLHRSVAIKVSAERFNERSEIEARAVAALNHPNICTLYDVGPNYLVMELIEGDTLSDRIRQGPLPLEEALDIARQIADALAAAHERGIVHRDLKPGNIKIRSDGSVKVLDFGLAKRVESAVSRPASNDSPTMTVATTEAGMILGTAAYMAPEQARGKTVDRRADIWAFGVVLWEMLTGQQLFEGETITDVLANVVHREPDWNRVPQRTRRLLRSCLERGPRKRLQDIGDARLLLDEEAGPVAASLPAPAQTVHSVSLVMGSKIAWGAAALLLLLLAPLAWFHFREKPPVAETVRFQVPLPGKFNMQYVTLSPDGRYLAYAGGTPDGVGHIWVRSLDTIEARMLPGTENGGSPFWSPDSRYIAFTEGGKLKKIDVTGWRAADDSLRDNRQRGPRHMEQRQRDHLRSACQWRRSAPRIRRGRDASTRNRRGSEAFGNLPLVPAVSAGRKAFPLREAFDRPVSDGLVYGGTRYQTNGSTVEAAAGGGFGGRVRARIQTGPRSAPLLPPAHIARAVIRCRCSGVQR
jgi:predicted Ser/Thr protein kinase